MNKQKIVQMELPHLGDFKYHYFVESTNFDTLSESDQEEKLQNFFEFIIYADTKIKFTMMHSPVNVPVGDDENKLFLAPRVYLSSNIPLDSFLEQYEYGYSRVLVPPFPIIKKETRNRLIIDAGEKGVYAKCYSLSELPKNQTSYGWIYRIFSFCEQLSFIVEPVDFEKASKMISNRMQLFQTKGLMKKSYQEKYQNLDAIYENLTNERTQLFKIKCSVLISGETPSNLKKNEKDFRIELRRFRGKFKAMGASQAATLYEDEGITLFIPTHVLAAFYPLISASILELPNGIPLGINSKTGEPVIIDFRKRKSTNIGVFGKTGSGKSMTVKVIKKRIIKTFPKLRVRTIDPSGEWEKEARYLGMDPVIISPDDPNSKGINVFKDLTSSEIANLIIEVTDADKSVKNEILAKCEGIKNILDLNEKLSPEGQNTISPLISGPVSKIFKGELEVTERMIYSLKGMDPDAPITHMVVYLILKRIWSEIKNMMTEENKDIISLLIIDEAWMLWKLKSAASFIDTVLRTGRKYGVYFILISQKPEDFIKADGGDSAISQIETIFIHRLNKNDVDKVKDGLKLSDAEITKIPRLKDGECIIHTDTHRVICQVTPTNEEYKRFTTRRGETSYEK